MRSYSIYININIYICAAILKNIFAFDCLNS